jgi:hypothetical protein
MDTAEYEEFGKLGHAVLAEMTRMNKTLESILAELKSEHGRRLPDRGVLDIDAIATKSMPPFPTGGLQDED